MTFNIKKSEKVYEAITLLMEYTQEKQCKIIVANGEVCAENEHGKTVFNGFGNTNKTFSILNFDY